MSNTIQIKRSSTSGSAPAAGQLAQGELAVNLADEALYTKDASNAVVKLNAPSIDDKNTGATKHVTIDASGNLLVGTTSGSGRVRIQKAAGAADGIIVLADSGGAGYSFTGSASTGTPAYFSTSSGQAGLISVSGNTTSYTSGSDYRLKENIRPLANALEKVATLKPVAFEWKTSGSYSESFLAHELAESFPFAVIGEKDAVDADGNPQYQGIDTSFLVATLTAAIQEQQAIIEQLKADVEALKAQA